MSSWTKLPDVEAENVDGASTAVLGDNIYFFGGDRGSPYIQVRCFSLQTFNWVPRFIESGNFTNRKAPAAVISGNIYLFGGRSFIDYDKNFDEVLIFEESKFSHRLSLAASSPAVAREGLTVCPFGQQLSYCAIFGGKNVQGVLSNELWVFNPLAKEDSDRFKRYEAGASPPGRMFHSATICGERNQTMIIHGGVDISRNELFGDLWVLDLSRIETSIQSSGAPAETEAQQAIGKASAMPAKGKSAVSTEAPLTLCSWSQVDFSGMSSVTISSLLCPRYMHSACVLSTGTSSDSFTLMIFGGIGDSGPLVIDATELSVASGKAVTAERKPQSDTAERIFIASSSVAFVSTLQQDLATNVQVDPPRCEIVLEFRANDECNKPSLIQYLILHESSLVSSRIKAHMDMLRRGSQIDENPSPASNIPSESNPTSWTYSNGDVYEGCLIKRFVEVNSTGARDADKKFARHGYGKMVYNSKNRFNGSPPFYEGEWLNDKRHGRGKFVYPSGIGSYEGNFEDDEMSGLGALTISIPNTEQLISAAESESVQREHGFPSPKFTYVGEFACGKFSGRGKLSVEDQYEFEGSFAEGKKTGEGSLKEYYENGLIGTYTGKFLDDLKRDESALCHFSDGSEYRGGYRAGRRNGHGVLVVPNCYTYSGKWVGGLKCGRGILESITGDRYEGVFDMNLPDGDGQMCYFDSSVYCGSWRAGKRHGRGRMVFKDGTAFDGLFFDDHQETL